MKKIIYLSICFLIGKISFAQKNVSTEFEAAKEQCKNLPADKRIRVTVARFSVTTSNAPSEFGGNLASMLTNALQGVNCYSVLESLKNKQDMNDEIDYGESGYAKKTTYPKKGKQLGAQLIITGEVTEYDSKDNAVRVGLLKVGGNKAKIGFIIKIINPETREVLYSQLIRTEAKTGGATEFGAFGVNLVSSGVSDPAVANACEQGIMKAVEYMASKRDSLNLGTAIKNNADPSSTNETEITLKNATFNSFSSFAKLLSTIPGFKSVGKTLDNGVGVFTVSHTGSDDNFLEEINKRIGIKYEVIGFDRGKIELIVK